MAPVNTLSHPSNPLATSSQLSNFQSAQSDTDPQSTIYASSQLTQAAGILLRLPQEVIATAIILLQRYLIQRYDSPKSPSLQLSSSAAIYLTAKLSFTPLSPRSVVNVYTYLVSPTISPLWFINPHPPPLVSQPDTSTYTPTEGQYERQRQSLFMTESTLLSALGFNTSVSLPYTLALTYLSALDTKSTTLPQRVVEYLNSALLSPQLLYLTHQPNALAVAAIYLASRETGTKLVDGNWWEVFDVDREDLGFLVLGMGSLEGFAEALRGKRQLVKVV